MAPATRVDFPGAWYHVLNRGTERRAIFRSTRCYEKFIQLLSSLPEAITNLLAACGKTASNTGRSLRGIKVGGEAAGALFESNPGLMHIECSSDARASYAIGVAAGTAWLFTRPEWKDVLDFLFIDEAGQVPLANAVAMARCAKNLILLGDQMQLEQPVQGSHPGDAGRISGPQPNHLSYSSFVSFTDPDGNGWLLQEVTKRLAGRIDSATTTFASANDLASAFRRAAAAHGEHEKRIGQAHPNWPDWYAEYMVREQSGEELPQ